MRNFIMMAALLFAAPADAATFDFDYDATVSLNPPPTTHVSQLIRTIVVLDDLPANVVPTSVSSDWGPLDCHLTADGHVSVTVSGSNVTWPTSLPPGNVATCSYDYVHQGKTHKLNLNLNLIQGPSHDWTASTIYGGPSVGLSVQAKEGRVGGAEELPALPPGQSYIEDVYPARKSNGDNWQGVWCRVRNWGNFSTFGYTVQVQDSGSGVGYCKIKRTGAPDAFIPVNVTKL